MYSTSGIDNLIARLNLLYDSGNHFIDSSINIFQLGYVTVSNWTCDFKNDFCSWEQSDLDTLDWEIAEQKNRGRRTKLILL